jgi:hypothetical protein
MGAGGGLIIAGLARTEEQRTWGGWIVFGGMILWLVGLGIAMVVCVFWVYIVALVV